MLLKYLDGNLITYVLGLVACIVSGLLYPFFTILMADILLSTF